MRSLPNLICRNLWVDGKYNLPPDSRLANAKTEEQTREMIEYMSAVPGLVQENALVGYLPTEREDILKRFIVYLIGRYMGASLKK